MEVHRAFGEFGLTQNVVESYGMVWTAGEFMGCGPQDLLPGRIRSSFRRMSRHRTR
jgi:hypothetical protein